MIIAGAISIALVDNPAETKAEVDMSDITQTPDPEWTMPDDYTFESGEDSPGEVTFSHDTHASYFNNNCMMCHSTTWSMLTPATPKEGQLTYERLHEEDLCYSCHNGEEHEELGMEIFSTQDFESCENCHW
jgi:c(7)-type cytochrome triheme protein